MRWGGIVTTFGIALTTVGAVLPFDSADALSIRASYGATTLLLADGAVGPPTDVDPVASSVQYIEGALGNATFAGLGFREVDIIGSRCTVCPSRLTLSVEAARGEAATEDFIVEVSDTGFSTLGPSVLAESDFSSIIDGVSATYETFIDTGDNLFGTQTLVRSSTLTGTDAVDFDDLFSTGPTNYSMTIRITYDGDTWLGIGAGTVDSQAQFRTSDVPVPAALPLMGLGLAALAVAARRRRARA